MTFALYCKSYHRDFRRLEILRDTIAEYNADNIPFYISTPASEQSLLTNQIGVDGYHWVSDEDVIRSNPRVDLSRVETIEPYVSQGIIKSEFWRLGEADNYLCLDSDSRFLKPFKLADFIHADGHPYTVIHQNKELWQLAVDRGQGKVVSQQLEEVARMKSLFQRTGPDYMFMPSPFLWSSLVWQSLDENMLAPAGKTLWDVIERGLGEYHWYGESLLAYGSIPLHPVEPYFRVYHYDWQYHVMRRLGETEAAIAENYLGVIYQSNWDFSLDSGKSNKSALSRAVRRAKQYLRQLQTLGLGRP